ncbi:unnamed protein product [Notodromas monacha]|uniref:ribonuclease H n=1 Tax=Notodromas monacha TaxID=399045 RepID=A0A7R9BZL7_9CRUS|nr:unnamed protein product [Notodromas monacha]CAG0923420.1 unnamed protein product [Notodromas monacha]
MAMIPRNILERARMANRNTFLYTHDGFAYCYADGSCMEPARNAGVGVWFGHNHIANISEPLSVPGTNNRAELLALLYAIHAAKASGLQCLEIRSDSKYAIQCVTDWLPKWKNNNWQTCACTSVENQVEIRAIDEARSNMNVRFEWVPGHSGDFGNGAADALAKAGATESLRMYRGY